jgi:hypothetical protein
LIDQTFFESESHEENGQKPISAGWVAQDGKQIISQGYNARLLASYARKWKTKSHPSPHGFPSEMCDFHEKCIVRGNDKYWSKVWNFVPNGSDYTHYIQAANGSKMFQDPLCEVGCSYTFRGFDYDYVGVLWLEDLVWRDGRSIMTMCLKPV